MQLHKRLPATALPCGESCCGRIQRGERRARTYPHQGAIAVPAPRLTRCVALRRLPTRAPQPASVAALDTGTVLITLRRAEGKRCSFEHLATKEESMLVGRVWP